MPHTQLLTSEQDTLELARLCSQALLSSLTKDDTLVWYLQADLGMGKTFFVRGLLAGLGWQAAVKSPTYTLVESYDLGEWRLHHLDLYRLAEAEELEYLGIRDLCAESPAVIMLEWPDKGAGFVPEADLVMSLEAQAADRLVTLAANTARGQGIVDHLQRLIHARSQ